MILLATVKALTRQRICVVGIGSLLSAHGPKAHTVEFRWLEPLLDHEPRRVTISAIPGGIMEIIVGYLFGVLYYKCMLCVLIRIASSRYCLWSYCKIKEENLPKLFVYRIWRKSLQTQERVRLIHGKRAIEVRAIDVPLYLLGGAQLYHAYPHPNSWHRCK